MKSIGIIQPGKLGDLIICLPIAKYYADNGYDVVWPIFYKYVDMFKEVVNFKVSFYPVTDNVYNCVGEAKNILKEKNIDVVFDIAATFPGSNCTDEYVMLGDGFGKEKFDEFKYRKSQVNFDLKWNLKNCISLNPEKEIEIYNNEVKQTPYNVVSLKHSRGTLDVKFETKHPIIEVNEKYNIFYWKKILENAKNIVLVDSALANLVDQLNLPNNKILLRKHGHPTPTFKSNWTYK
jgi:hypothetical protein